MEKLNNLFSLLAIGMFVMVISGCGGGNETLTLNQSNSTEMPATASKLEGYANCDKSPTNCPNKWQCLNPDNKLTQRICVPIYKEGDNCTTNDQCMDDSNCIENHCKYRMPQEGTIEFDYCHPGNCLTTNLITANYRCYYSVDINNGYSPVCINVVHNGEFCDKQLPASMPFEGSKERICDFGLRCGDDNKCEYYYNETEFELQCASFNGIWYESKCRITKPPLVPYQKYDAGTPD